MNSLPVPSASKCNKGSSERALWVALRESETSCEPGLSSQKRAACTSRLGVDCVFCRARMPAQPLQRVSMVTTARRQSEIEI